MAKSKIAILGGGMAGLSAAYQLTRTPELRRRYDVTIYQMGWRLGGKVASGRDARGRNLEHGLHVWFGCYENVFQMLQEVYRKRIPLPGSPLRDWTDVVKPQDYTPVGVFDGEEWSTWPLTWPENPGIPGDGTLMPSLMEAIALLIGWVKEILRGSPLPSEAEAVAAAGPPPFVVPPAGAATSAARSGWQRARAAALARPGGHGVHRVAEVAHLHALSLSQHYIGRERELQQMVGLIGWLRDAFNGTIGAAAVPGSRSHMVHDILDIFQAFIRGVVSDLLLPDQPFESLDGLDFRAWLLRHGADETIVATSTVVRVVYDTLFQYADGDADRPSYAAGTALGVIIRLLATYKGAMMWDLQAGMGEAVVAPLYQALLAAGVSVKFFRKVVKLELSPDKRRIQTVQLVRQAEVEQGDYRPTFELGGLTCWPSEPFWDQLQNGWALKDARVNFESHWYTVPPNLPPPREEALQHGTDFDTIVLAVSLGAYKPLNNDPGMCDELIANNDRFADFVTKIGIVPSQAIQLWSDRTLGQLGWMSGKPALVSGPEYLNIWADMSQVLHVENAPFTPVAKSLHYLTGTFNTTLYKEPAARQNTPAIAADAVRQSAIDWLNTKSSFIWPNARSGQSFDWNVLTDPSDGAGIARFDAQFWRANIDPTECCVLSSAGTTQYRLRPNESGFDNLVLAGEATRHGFNTTTVEGAVMSGMAASRAICGEPATIVGYDFLERRPSQGPVGTASGSVLCPPAASTRCAPLPASALFGWLGDILAPCGNPSSATRRPKARAASDEKGSPAAAALPPFIPWIGHGAVSLAPRGVFTGAKAYLFAVEASARGMQALVDALLNRASDGAVRYESLFGMSLITFMNIAQCTSDTDAIGWLPGRECAFWVPLLEVHPGRPLDSRLVLWSPYIFINYDIGMVTGREVWGWPKVFARIGIAEDLPRHPAAFTCSTTIFREALSPNTRGERAVLFSITSPIPLAPTPVQWRDGRNAAQLIIGDLLAGVAAEIQARLRLQPMVPAVVVRQLRDLALPGCARIQEIVDSPIRITKFAGGGLLPGDFSLHITTCNSHRIAQDLLGVAPGAESTVVPVQWAAWAAFDFEAPAGRRIAGWCS